MAIISLATESGRFTSCVADECFGASKETSACIANTTCLITTAGIFGAGACAPGAMAAGCTSGIVKTGVATTAYNVAAGMGLCATGTAGIAALKYGASTSKEACATNWQEQHAATAVTGVSEAQSMSRR